MNDLIPNNKQEMIDKLLENLPTNVEIEVELPTKNKVSCKQDPTKPVTVRPMNFEDEKAIASQKGKTDPINMILSRCATNINVADLITPDKLFLLIKLREVSYGENYECELPCQHCDSLTKTTIKLGELPITYAGDDFCDPSEVFLTGIKKKVKVRLIKTKDEAYFKDPSMIMNHIWRFVEEIDGVKDKTIISAVIEKMPSKDIKKIVNAMRSDLGINTKIAFDCASCQKESVVELPINADFFEES